eukprot:CAMPEP_0183301038 /NCGR_PEP_ID=MMETSP0160_2-20130417/7263_1 /TAXON_ID=2839 ORGANISM="Odontella Sinensis, Strain Grunow 1884" /NCGR_SAMPLE_ID=MMETSP0160_2 /ASSEMBLY_ACC=CAM_ASM_000250 /LENGTH=262 /DNA_ID=CAMNT_0025463559 /DNA_START=417 /DNA_END=1202 /DNA_ORIENTATION=-
MAENSDDAMRMAIKEFMLGKTGTLSMKEDEMKQKSLSSMITSKGTGNVQDVKKLVKRHWQIFKMFCTCLQNEWLYLDDQLEAVMESLAGIRSRLPIQNKVLLAYSQPSKEDWRQLGYQHSVSHMVKADDFLRKGDVELTLAHNFAQHEKMLTHARSLLLDLSECQDYLGRKLDDILKLGLEFGHIFSGEGSQVVALQLIDVLSCIFPQLAMELHRKQCLSRLVFDSVSDSLLISGTGRVADNHGASEDVKCLNPYDAITKCN